MQMNGFREFPCNGTSCPEVASDICWLPEATVETVVVPDAAPVMEVGAIFSVWGSIALCGLGYGPP